MAACIVGSAHSRFGRQQDASALDALCIEHIACFKRPKADQFPDRLPKNNYGKVLKTELRQRLQSPQAENRTPRRRRCNRLDGSDRELVARHGN